MQCHHANQYGKRPEIRMTELLRGILIPNPDYGEANPPGLHDGLFRCRADDGVLNSYFYGALVLVLADSDANVRVNGERSGMRNGLTVTLQRGNPNFFYCGHLVKDASCACLDLGNLQFHDARLSVTTIIGTPVRV